MASEEQGEQQQGETAQAETPIVLEEQQEFHRVVMLTGHGGLNKVEVQRVAKPKPGEGHVLIKVHASGLNFADLMQRQGNYPGAPSPPPYVMGYESSGVVEAVGEGVTQFEVGARVVTISASFGNMAEYVSAPVGKVFAIPDSMSFEDAAALPLNYITAYQILFDICNLKEGESVLVQMAGGGVGVAATQLCKTVPNVTVFGTASEPKHEKIKEHGVTHPIDYRKSCFAKEVHKIQPDGVDIVMDPLGGKDTLKGYDLLKPFGRIVCFGAANVVKGVTKGFFSGAKQWFQTSSFSPFKLMGDNRVVAGYHLGIIGLKHPDLVRPAMEALIKLYEEGKIKPEIHHVFSLEEIRSAMQCMHDRKNIGKVLLSPLKEPPAPEPKEEPKGKEPEKKEEEKADEKIENKPTENATNENGEGESEKKDQDQDEAESEKKDETAGEEDKPSEDA